MIWLAHSGSGLATLTSLTFSTSMLGFGRCSTMIPRSRFSVVDDASLANLLASSLCLRRTCCILKCLNHDFSFATMERYCFIHPSFASYSPCIYPTISWESLLTLTILAPSAWIRHRPVNNASYLASLLVALNLNLMAYSSLLPFGD